MNYLQGNSNISHTYHIYLDSDAGRVLGNTYQFDISPTIEVAFPQRGDIYLKEFSGLNNLYNINTTNQTNTIDVNGTPYTRQLPIGHYSTLDEFVVMLNATFGDAGDSGTNFALVQNTNFADINTLKIQATNTSAGPPPLGLTFSGPVFERILNFSVNTIVQSPHSSSREVDIHRSTHNVYMSIAEVSNNTRDVGTALSKGNRIAKIPISTGFGAYIVYQALQPVQKSPVENAIINQLNIQLFNDDGVPYKPDRFTITLALEILVPVQSDYRNQLMQNFPGNYSATSKLQPVLNSSKEQFC